MTAARTSAVRARPRARRGEGDKLRDDLLEATERLIIESGDFRPVDAAFAATALWTAVHGITSLLISLPDFPWPDVDALVDHVCDIQIRGLSEPVHEPKESS